MTSIYSRYAAIAAVIGAGLCLSACTESQVNMAPDFGRAVRQDVVAQIADPDAHYAGDPAPGTNGPRVELAQKRYVKGQVIQPSTMTGLSGATNADNGASGGNGGGIGSSGGGASAGVASQ